MARHLVERELTSEGPSQRPPRRGGRSVTVNLAESPLTWLHARGHLSDRQLAAGDRLRDDWERAQLLPGTTMRWDPVRVSGGLDRGLNPGERQIAAKRRFDAAIARDEAALADADLYTRDPAKFAALTTALDKARAEKDAAEERWLQLAEMVEG